MSRSGSTNLVLRKTIYEMRKQKVPLWKKVAKDLSSPSRKRVIVNVGKIGKLVPQGGIAVVPGKVLGVGKLDHEVTVAAFDFSKSALAKIKAAGGKAVFLGFAVKEFKDLKSVKVIK